MFAPVEGGFDRIVDVHVDVGEVDGHLGDDRQAALGGVGHAREGVDGRHLDGEVDAADSGEVGREHEQVGRVGKWGQRPGEQNREREPRRWAVVDLFETNHLVFETEHRSGVDVEGQMQVDRPGTRFLGVEIHLPQLPERVGLHEVSFVVDVKSVIDRLTLDVGDKSRNVDDCHRFGHYRPVAWTTRTTQLSTRPPRRSRGIARSGFWSCSATCATLHRRSSPRPTTGRRRVCVTASTPSTWRSTGVVEPNCSGREWLCCPRRAH